MADVFQPTFRCRDPMTVSPRWVLADVLLVAALKRGHPIQLFIQVKTDNFSRKTLKLSLWFHDLLSGRGFHVNTLRGKQRRFTKLRSKRAQFFRETGGGVSFNSGN